MLNIKFFISFIGLFSFVFSAMAGTGSSTGGGSYVVIDGNIMLADPYFAGVPARALPSITESNAQDFPADLYNYIRQSSDLLHNLGIDLWVSGKYLLVPPGREENVPCDRYLPILNREVDEHIQYGCTFRQDTYLFVSQFNRLSVKQQFLALAHERLWTITPAPSQAAISAFVTALMNVLPDYETQMRAIRDGQPLPAPHSIETKLRTLLAAARAAGVLESDSVMATREFTITAHGGFIDRSCATSVQNSTLGIGSQVFNCTPRTRIINSQIFMSRINNASLQSSHVVNSSLSNLSASDSIFQKSILHGGPHDISPADISSVISHARLTDSDIVSPMSLQGTATNPISFFRVNFFKDVIFGFHVAEGVQLSGISIGGSSSGPLTRFTIGANTHLTDFQLEMYKERADRCHAPIFEVQIEANTQVRNGQIILKDCGTVNPENLRRENESHYFTRVSQYRLGDARRGFAEDMAGREINLRGANTRYGN